MKPKVFINTISLLSPLTGIGRYTYEISKKIKKSKKFYVNFYYGYLSNVLLEPKIKTKVRTIKSIVVSNSFTKKIGRWIVEKKTFFLPEYDIYWEPNFIPLKHVKAKKIVTSIHDFSFLLYKEYHPKERIKYFEKNFFKNIKRSDFIITGSYFTKQEIIENLDIDPNRIKVIYHGIDHNKFRVLKNFSIDINLPDKFILSVGSIEPRKNLLNLLRAYDILNIDLKKQYKLVIVGFKGWENEEIMNIINNNKNYVYYLGYVSESNLVKIYNLATIFVYPSFYEGFGLPPIEAMACGTPVITSNLTSIPEICEKAAIYCNPYDIYDIKEKIENILKNENLLHKMKIKGLQRAKKFNWEKSAKEHIELFKGLLSENSNSS